MKSLPRPVCPRFVSVLLLFAFVLWGGTLLSCRKEPTDFGAGQRAQKKEVELQNKTLLEQFVLAVEELENHADQAYPENALLRLNPWLESCAASRDFQANDEYAARADAFLRLGQTAAEIESVCAKAAPAAQGEGEGAALTEDDAKLLPEKLDQFLAELEELNASYRSPLLTRYGAMAAELKKGVSEAGTFQFGGRAKMVASAIARFSFTPLMNFRVISEGAARLAELYRLDRRSFLPEDVSHFKSSVWERNIAAWAKGDTTDPTRQTMNLFRWTCDVIALSDEAESEPIPRQAWQALLTSQGTPLERASVFMGLLRQIGITSFLIKPTDPAREAEFPVLVGAVIPGDEGNKVLLFLPECAVPVPGGEGPSVSDATRGLTFPSVATLEEASQNDAIWRRLDLDGRPFPLTAADLVSVRAVLPTDMFNMSHRMWIMMRESVIERTDAQGDAASFVPPLLAMSFESAKNEIASLPCIASVEQGWEFQTPVVEQTILPVESQILLLPYLYEVPASSSLSMRSDDESSKKYAPTEGAGSGSAETSPTEVKMIHPLWEGKILFFKGRFDTESGAANRLQQGRVPDRLLKQATYNIETQLGEYLNQVQKSQGEGGESLSEDQIRAAAAQFVNQTRQDIGMKLFLKVTARFYLGLVSYALHNEDAALAHFEDSDLLDKLGGIWRSASLTLIAEIYESRGDYSRAQKIYGRLEGAAALSGKIRAKWLGEAAPAESAEESEPESAE